MKKIVLTTLLVMPFLFSSCISGYVATGPVVYEPVPVIVGPPVYVVRPPVVVRPGFHYWHYHRR